MLSFFRINDPYRLLGVFIILILIRIPFLTNTDLIILPEIKWMLLGEKLGNGFILYKQVWDTTGPFAALTYTVINLIFGDSILSYRIIALLLTTIYALLYSKILIDNNIYLEKSYVPAIIFGVLSCIYFDMFTLSPAILGLIFIIFALNSSFQLLDKGINDHQYYNLGFLVGIAGLFYLPYNIYIIFVLLAFFFFSNTSLRKYLLTILGFCFPYLVLIIIYSLNNGLESLYYMYIVSFLTSAREFYLRIDYQIILLVIPLFLVVLSFGKLLIVPRFINYQQKAQRLMLLYLVTSVFSYLITIEISPMHLFVFLPGFVFFITHYFLLVRKKFLGEISFTLFVFAIILLNYSIYYGMFSPTIPVDNRLIVQNTKQKFHNKRILVLGEDISPYKDNALASPYLNWTLAKNHFLQLDYYEVVLAVNENLSKDLPEIIIDQNNSTKKLFDRIPLLANRYESCGKNIYCLK